MGTAFCFLYVYIHWRCHTLTACTRLLTPKSVECSGRGAAGLKIVWEVSVELIIEQSSGMLFWCMYRMHLLIGVKVINCAAGVLL